MGLPMANIHEPTVNSSGGQNGTPANGQDSGKSLQELMSQKEQLEAELSALGSVLDSHGVNMNTTLTTFDGYPRDDIDIAQIRTTRARIIRLRNDHKSLMSRIETALHAHFAAGAPPLNTTGSDVGTASALTSAQEENSSTTPSFAKVNSVVPGSPAAEAGLQAGDNIRNFGDVNWLNHESLRKVGQVVQQNEGRPILVKVTRRNDSSNEASELSLTLIPRADWGGRGLLGCHIVVL